MRSARHEDFFRQQAIRSRRAERRYAVMLRSVARQIEIIVSGLYADEATRWDHIEQALDDYADLITPWARSVAERMLADVAQRDFAAWVRLGRKIGRNLAAEVNSIELAPTLWDLQQAQVQLIRSIPLDAKLRVNELAREALVEGGRWNRLSEAIAATGKVSKGQANTIARTETARTASEVQATRAQGLGSDGFVWRTSRDADVRPLHRLYEGRFFRWNDPPPLDDGRRGLPGTIYNCRCWAEPVIAGETPETGPLARNPEYLAALRGQGYTTGTAFENT